MTGLQKLARSTLCAWIVLTWACGPDRVQPTGPQPAGALSNAASSGSDELGDPDADRSCLRARYRAADLRWDIQLYPADSRPGATSRPTLCARELDELGMHTTRQCWAVDDRGLRARRQMSISASTSTAAPGRLDENTGQLPWTIDNLQGDRRALITEQQVEIRALPSQRVLGRMHLREPDGSRGLSAAPSDAYFVHDVLFVVDHDAGPHADVVGFAPPSSVFEVAAEVYHGAVAILDDRRVGLASPALLELIIYDAHTGVQTQFKRTVPKFAACTAEQVDEYLLEPDLDCSAGDERPPGGQVSCCQELDAALGPYMDASMVALDAGHVLVALTGARRGEVALIDLEGQKIAREWSLWCAP